MKRPWRKEDWDHYEFRRARWPEGETSWTYKRSVNPFMWKWFGNDTDGCEPWALGKKWTWWSWWWRNRAANRAWCVTGLAIWKEGLVGDDAWPTSPTLERKWWVGGMEELDVGKSFILSWVRDSANGRTWWRPYIRIPLPFKLAFWWGWKPTSGHSTCSLKRTE